jgi:cytochrome c oxidase subunit I+III
MTRVSGPGFAELERTWASGSGLPGFITAVNHKQVGKRFVWTALVFLVIGGVESLLLRLQLADSESTILGPEAYNQLFTMHGTTMMFLFAVPVLEGLAMYLVPLQIGARDMPLPRLNAFGYWLYLFGGILLHWSFLTGDVPDGGWFAYTPLTGPEFSPGAGIDFWLFGVTLLEISGIIGALELVVLILRFRAPGMSLRRIPLFSWSALVMASMILFAFPFVIAASSLLEIERKLGAPFYDPAGGGDPLLWQHLFWIFGHPEVYIMLIPAAGIVSAVVAAHVKRPIVAYPLVVAALVGIAVASFGLWVHHMFTVGLPVLVLSLFAIASFFIAVPSGIQVFAWIATVWEGRPVWRTPLWFAAGFLFIFVLGGITGVMVATAPFDTQAHDSFFVVAHFHYVLIGGVVFPLFAGLHHWFPKLIGRLPSETAGKVAFWLMFVGFNVTFFPQHWLGLQGMVRRTYTYPEGLGWEAANLASTVGSFVLAAGFAVFLGNLAHASRRGLPAGSNPWDAESLEWATTSPPGNHNFDEVPLVGSLNPLWDHADHGFDPATVEALGVLGRPWRQRRELVMTSVIEAEPEAIVVIPGNSPWPLAAATAIVAGLVGVLVDSALLVGVGVVTVILALYSWTIGTRKDEGLEVSDEDRIPAGDRRRAAEHFARLRPMGRSASWWGTVAGLVAITTVVSAFVYAYFYLRLGAEAWPPDGTASRALGLPMAAALVMATALLLGVVAPGAVVARFLGLIVVCLGVSLQVGALAASGYRVDVNAFESVTIVLEVLAALLAGVAALVRVGALARTVIAPHDSDPAQADAVFWKGALALWLVLWAVIHLSPLVLW